MIDLTEVQTRIDSAIAILQEDHQSLLCQDFQDQIRRALSELHAAQLSLGDPE